MPAICHRRRRCCIPHRTIRKRRSNEAGDVVLLIAENTMKCRKYSPPMPIAVLASQTFRAPRDFDCLRTVMSTGSTMSRDFELLQRVEQERSRSSHSTDPFREAFRAVDVEPGIDQEQPETATQLSAHLASSVRNELTKLVLRTFLSTPALKVVMFTGVEAGEGAKWIAACPADVLANAIRGRVCLLDADLEC